MINKKPLVVQALLKSALPFLFGGSFHLLKACLSNPRIYNASNNGLHHDGGLFKSSEIKQGLLEAQNNRINSGPDFVTFLDEISFGIYTNFFTFLLAMLLIDLLLKIGKNLWKQTKSSSTSRFTSSSHAQEWKWFKMISENQIKRIFCYAVIFMALQILGLFWSLVQSEVFPNLHHPALISSQSADAETIPQMNLMVDGDDQRILRALEEELDEVPLQNPLSSSSSMVPDKISLSMGSILSSLSLNVNAMVLSKDKKTAFVTIDFYGTLKIIDLSDLQSPLIISSLNLRISSYSYRIKSLLLSSDEKTLYASNSKDLEIIDVTDLSSPKLISATESQLLKDFNAGGASSYFKTSLAVSESTKTLYIGGLGLQVYDISDPGEPVLLKALKNDVRGNAGFARNEICLSRDEQILFVVNGSLDVYNISNPKDMKSPLYSFKTESSPRSLLLLEDDKTLLLLGTSETAEIIFEEADITQLDSLTIKKTVKLGHNNNAYSPRFLAISPSKSKIFIFAHANYLGNHDLLVFDRIKETTLKVQNSLIEEAFTMDFSLDGKTLLTGSNEQFMTIELFLDYPNTQIFSTSQENLVNNTSFPSCGWLQMSPDGQYLFALCVTQTTPHSHILTIWDVRNLSQPIGSYNTRAIINQMHFTNNYQTVYLRSGLLIMVLDITNKDQIQPKDEYSLEEKKKEIQYFIPSGDGKTGFVIRTSLEAGYYIGSVSFIDLSTRTRTEKLLAFNLEFNAFNSRLVLKDNDKTLIVLGKNMTIFDISEISSPKQVASLPFGVNEPDPDLLSHNLSPDEKTLFIQTVDQNGLTKLKIYNVSISASPQLITEKYFPRRSGAYGVSLSLDLKTGYLSQQKSLIKLNLTDLKQPQITGVIPLSKGVSNYVISPDGKTIYASNPDVIRVINMDLEYTLFLKQEKFLLGKKYSDRITMLRLNEPDYNIMGTGFYKIIRLSLLDMKVSPNHYSLEMKTSPLPSWMTFNRESNTLTVEAKKQRDLGTYTLCSNFSLKVPRDVFNNLGTAENPLSSQDLWAWLISLDYVDPKMYLTDNFGEIDEFLLPSNFSLYREEIYNILKTYHVETCTSFEVVSSLELNNKSLPAISSLSTGQIKIEVKLEPKDGVEAKFVNRHYGSLIPTMKDYNKTKISLEGTVKEINTAISSIIVNFENGTSCDADMMIMDGLNPPLSTKLTNISSYFKSNEPPRVNKRVDETVQEQIDRADIQTGKYFTYTLSDDIFEDEYAESLKYEIILANNNTAFPTWLNANGLTLKGTPPEEISGRDLELVLVAKNEFKENKMPFRLHISISAVFWLKLVMRYSPYILTLIGLFVSANKIFNILKKGAYKHSKEFYVGVGAEISGGTIFPISFIKEEQKQSDLILKRFQEKGDINVTDFIAQDRKAIEKEKITSTIKEAIWDMPVEMKRQITLHPNPIIDQIIVNKFIWMQLDLESERKTRSLFEDLKGECLEVVEKDGDHSGFTINQEKLNKLIKKVLKSHTERNLTLEESLIRQDPEVNIDLLKDAILAFAFESHSIDISPVDIDIGVKQKVPSNFLWRFLKLDLRDIYLNERNKFNYGINYQITDDQLCFYGVSQNYLKGKTLVVQIKTLQQRIMKEIWIHGVSSDFQRDVIFMIRRDEQEMRGQGYEIY